MSSLYDKEKEKSINSETKKPDKKKKSSPLDQIANNLGQKDKQISAKVNNATYELFSRINRAQGLSNNSALNMIINRYVRENKALIED